MAPHRAKGGPDLPLRSWASGLALATGVVALTYLIGGQSTGIGLQPGPPAGSAGMPPTTAASLVLTALAIILATTTTTGRQWRLIGGVLGALAGAVALLGLGLDLGLGAAGLSAPLPTLPGVAMAKTLGLLLAAFCAMTLSLATPPLDTGLGRICRAGSGLGLILSFAMIQGVVFDPTAGQALAIVPALGLPGLLCLAAMFVALCLGNASKGWVARLFAPSGQVARRLLPLVLILPLLVGRLPLVRLETALDVTHFQFGLITIALTLLCAVVLVLRLPPARLRPDRLDEQMLRRVLDGQDTAVFLLDQHGEVRFANQRAADLARISEAASPAAWLYDTPFHTLDGARRVLRPAERPAALFLSAHNTPPRHPMSRMQNDARLRTEAPPEAIELGCLDAAGNEQILHFSARPLSDGHDGDLFVVSVQDRTADRAVPALSLGTITPTMSRGQIPEVMAHNMRNIFGAIRLSADAGLLRDDPNMTRRYFNAIRKACEKGIGLTDAMTDGTTPHLVATSAGPVFDVTIAVADAIEQSRKLMPPELLVECELPPLSFWVQCDPGALNAVLLNLLINARNAIVTSGRRNGRILVCIEDRPQVTCITIIDNGPGMSEQVLARATEPFFTTSDTQGGLGLATSLAFAHDNGGHFELSSQEGHGTTARLMLPTAHAPDRPDPHRIQRSDAIRIPDRHAPSRPSAGSKTDESTPRIGPRDARSVQPAASTLTSIGISLAGLRVLVVEDDPLYGEILAESLRILGAEIEMCESGAQVATLLQNATDTAPFDVLVTDINLPGQYDGYEVADMLRRYQPGISVVFMSGFGAPAPGIDPSTRGTFLRKPVSVADMASAIAASARNGDIPA
ncbi:ATP-binding response regulator [Pseudooceanicola sediminis]|nr:ATP-binding protein [Pseudooceanicola sediminis]|tara:strand:+ start:34094 stop:36658 length:2565 start_codon:yes stop_codon:yes gene_type:complete